jgi:hypothetical protein
MVGQERKNPPGGTQRQIKRVKWVHSHLSSRFCRIRSRLARSAHSVSVLCSGPAAGVLLAVTRASVGSEWQVVLVSSSSAGNSQSKRPTRLAGASKPSLRGRERGWSGKLVGKGLVGPFFFSALPHWVSALPARCRTNLSPLVRRARRCGVIVRCGGRGRAE